MKKLITKQMLDDLDALIQSDEALTLTEFCNGAGLTRQTVHRWYSEQLPRTVRRDTYQKFYLALYGTNPEGEDESLNVSQPVQTLLDFINNIPEDQHEAIVNKFIAENYTLVKRN